MIMNDPAFIFLMVIMVAINAILVGVVLMRINKISKEVKAARWYAAQNARTDEAKWSKSASIRSIAE